MPFTGAANNLLIIVIKLNPEVTIDHEVLLFDFILMKMTVIYRKGPKLRIGIITVTKTDDWMPTKIMTVMPIVLNILKSIHDIN